MTDAAGNFTAYVYDPFGNLLSATDPLGHVLSQTFDALGRRLTLSDPDLGSLTTVSNVLGQPTQETDAKGQVRTLAYDLLGRVTQRTEADGSTTFTYDTAANGVGQLASASGTTAGQSYSRSVAYDASARPSTSTVVVDGRTYATTVQYDSSGRVSGTVYPGGFTTRNLYNTAGHLFRVENASTSAPYWIKEAENAAGQTTQESFGSSVLRTQRTYDPLTQRPTQIRTGPGTSSTVQNLNYAWNAVGVLTQRSDTNRSLTENFQYDSLNRLTQSQVVGQTAITYTYNAVGNLLTKSDVGTYTYGSTAHRHAVTATAGALPRTYTYDANGNQTERFNGSVSVGAMAYTSFDKPSSISATTPGGVQVSQFRYDDGRNLLVRRDIPPAGDTKTTYYAADGAFEEVLYSSGPVEQRHYIRGANGPVGVFTTKTATPSSLRYMLRDHLGSLDVIASDTGAVLESLSYDAFGKRRNANWTPSGTPIVSGLNKGFTNHEELDNVGLVHMGGRVYDPTLGRFLSADPYVQFPYNTQGLNRYSYVLNNPLSFNDPTGFGLGDFFKRLFKKIGTAFKNPRTWLSLAGCITTGSTCYDLGVQLAQAALWGDEVPKSIQRSQRIASALSSLRAPSQRIIGIRNEVKLPDTTDQWADAKNGRGGTILNVENECRSSGTPFCATPSKARTAELTAQFGEGIVIGITLVLESTDKHSRINLDESTITIGFGAAASFRSSGPLSGAPGPLPKLTLPLTAPEPKQPKFFLFNDVSIQHPLYGAGVDVKVMLPSTRPISISPSFGQGFSVIGVGVGASFSGIRDATLTYSEIFEQRANPNDLTPFGGP